MARSALISGLLLAGCLHVPAYAPQRTVAIWRTMQPASAPVREPHSTAPTSDALDASQTCALALAHNPDLAALAARSVVAAADVRAAREIDGPQLRLTNFNVDDVVDGRAGMNLGVRMPIPRPGSVRAQVAGARFAADDQRTEIADAGRRLCTRVHKLFARLALLHADREHVTRTTAVQASTRAQLEDRRTSAVATSLDVALADVAVAEARDEDARILGEIGRSEAELVRLVGAQGPLRFRVDRDELQLRDLALDRDALIEQALGARPELRAAHARVGQALADNAVARGKAWPWFDWAQVQYHAGPGASAAAFGFGVALTIPVFGWNLGEIKATRAYVRQRELEERARIAAVADEVDEAVARVEQTARRVLELERGLLPGIEAAAREADAALAAGALAPGDANQIATRVIAARRVHLVALFDHRDAVLDLEAAIGAPLAAARSSR